MSTMMLYITHPRPGSVSADATCSYCDQPVDAVVHDARGCVPTCLWHAQWRAGQGAVGGHDDQCELGRQELARAQ